MVVNGLPRGQVVGELSPLATRFEDIQDGVGDFAQGVVSGVSAGFVAVEGAFEGGVSSFVVGQVCLVGFRVMVSLADRIPDSQELLNSLLFLTNKTAIPTVLSCLMQCLIQYLILTHHIANIQMAYSVLTGC